MDWHVIFTSVVTALISSSVITAGVTYVIKKSFDFQFAKLLEENRLHVQETARRQGKIYDQQSDVLKKILVLAYRLQDTTLTFAQQLSDQEVPEKEAIREALRKYKAYHATLSDIMFEKRMLLPHEIFASVEGLRYQTNTLSGQIEKARTFRVNNFEDVRQQLHERAIVTASEVDKLFQELVWAVQEHMGVAKNN